MFGAFKKGRTKVVADLLSRLESHVVILTRATLAQLSGTPATDAESKVAASGRRDLIPGAPLSNLGQLDLSGTPSAILASLDGIVAKAEQVQGSKAGLSAEAQQLVDDHYRDLAGIRRAIASCKSEVGTDDMSASIDALTEACNALDTTGPEGCGARNMSTGNGSEANKSVQATK